MLSKNRKTSVRIFKSDTPVAVQDRNDVQPSIGDDLIHPPYSICELRKLKTMSTILGQCVDAYKRNIVGFGADIKYNTDDTQAQETPEMKAEWGVLQEFIDLFNFDKSFEAVFAQAIEHREECGNGYLEIIRDSLQRPVEGVNVIPDNIYISKITQWTDVAFVRNGRKYSRKVQFRKYCQNVNGKKIWFKAFGDLRPMNVDTGIFDDNTPIDKQANEMLHLKLGDGTYGIPRWIGQLIHMYGARKAEELNYNYFVQGRHTPAALLLSNAELSEESEKALTEYASSLQGTENSHKFLVIETISNGDTLMDDKQPAAKVELKSMAEMLQQDALFLEYDDASREKVQSAFGLPDIYVGRSKDFNRATADTARAITEEQVFEPERNDLEWLFNNKILLPFEFKFVQLKFHKPEITNVEELVKLLTVYIAGNALAPNDLRDHAGHTLGKTLEPFADPKFDEPLAAAEPAALPKPTAVAKALDENIVSTLKDIRDYIGG